MFVTSIMTRPFFLFLAAEKSLQRVIHHERFLRNCKLCRLVPKGLMLQRCPNVAMHFRHPEFASEWSSALYSSSSILQDLLLQNAPYAKQQALSHVEAVTNSIIDSVGLNEYLRKRADVSRNLRQPWRTPKKRNYAIFRVAVTIRSVYGCFTAPCSTNRPHRNISFINPMTPSIWNLLLTLRIVRNRALQPSRKPFLFYPRSTVSRTLRFLVRVPHHVTPNAQ